MPSTRPPVAGDRGMHPSGPPDLPDRGTSGSQVAAGVMLILLGIAGVLVVAVDVGGNFVLTTEMSANRESIEFAIASVGVFMISAGVGVIRRSHRWLVAGIVLAAVLLAVFAQQTLTQVLGGRELPLFHNSEFTGWHLLLEVTATVVPVFALYTLLRTQWRLDR